MQRFTASVWWIGVTFLVALFILILITIAWPGRASAHSWYDRQCCGDGDCAPVACDAISARDGGFEYRDYAGATYFFTREKMKISLDDNCHVCISLAHSPTCVYLPARTERRLWTRPSF